MTLLTNYLPCSMFTYDIQEVSVSSCHSNLIAKYLPCSILVNCLTEVFGSCLTANYWQAIFHVLCLYHLTEVSFKSCHSNLLAKDLPCSMFTNCEVQGSCPWMFLCRTWYDWGGPWTGHGAKPLIRRWLGKNKNHQ